jgi:hypothetical protein
MQWMAWRDESPVPTDPPSVVLKNQQSQQASAERARRAASRSIGAFASSALRRSLCGRYTTGRGPRSARSAPWSRPSLRIARRRRLRCRPRRRPALSSCSTSWRRFPIQLLDVAESEAVESLPNGPRDASEAGASRHPEGGDPSDVQVYDLQLDARDALFFENRIFRTALSERPCVKSSDVQTCLSMD